MGEDLRIVVGLAVSNDHVATPMFQASHILAACKFHAGLRLFYEMVDRDTSLQVECT
jgi:hypothetical protein